MTWQLDGTYLEACNCASACPCIFLSDPTEGDCGDFVGWHIDRGSDDGVSLDGLNVMMAVYSAGNMSTTPWSVALYIDARASDEQRESLTRIFGGQAGGHPAALASYIGEVLGVESTPIEYHAGDKRISMHVAGVGRAALEPIEGQGGGPVTIEGHPLAVAPGFPITAGRSIEMSYQGHGMSWAESDKNAFVAPFSYRS